jgi:S1-C subfamily serine protease
MKRTAVILALLATLAASLACSTSILSTGVTAGPTVEPPPFTPAPTLAPISGDTAAGPAQIDRLAGLYANINPGVVSIIIFPAGATAGSLPLGQGSGFVIDEAGHIVTNDHVVADAGEIEVDFPSGVKAWADLIGTDLDSDLAVLQVDVPAEALVPIPLGDSDAVHVGDSVLAIGNPFGLSSTMTVGVVSAVGRTLDSERQAPTGGTFTAGDIIQTDAAINPGNSGGPLLNLNGEVIGVNRAIRTDSTTAQGSPTNSGIGFAVPVNIVRRVVPAIIETGSYDYPYLGVSSLSADVWNLKTLEALDLPTDATGAYVTCVTPGGPAEAAGIMGAASCDEVGVQPGGDLIIAIDGHMVREFSDMLSYLINNKRPGDTVTLTVIRGGEEVDVDIALEGRS